MRAAFAGSTLLLLVASPLAAQSPSAVARERTAFTTWLNSAPTSPRAAVALQRVGAGISLGPTGTDMPLPGLPVMQVSQSGGRVSLDSAGITRVLVRNRALAVGPYRLLAAGGPGRATLMAFEQPRKEHPPSWYPYTSAEVDTVVLAPAASPAMVVLLEPEGSEVEAREAGTVTITRDGVTTTLRVRALPGDGPDESDLVIYLRDGTSGHGSYPAGRFVTLEPIGAGRYRLDFNRARNPWCAYSSVFPCPAPWPGNTITAPIRAGEQYASTP